MSTAGTQMPRAPGPDQAEGSAGLRRAHDPYLPRPLGPLQEDPRLSPGRRRQTHVGLGAGGLDTQAIRKSFFLLAFPEREKRGG